MISTARINVSVEFGYQELRDPHTIAEAFDEVKRTFRSLLGFDVDIVIVNYPTMQNGNSLDLRVDLSSIFSGGGLRSLDYTNADERQPQ